MASISEIKENYDCDALVALVNQDDCTESDFMHFAEDAEIGSMIRCEGVLYVKLWREGTQDAYIEEVTD